MIPSFIHLRAHSSFSLSEGAIQVKDLVGLTKANAMPALALTDTGNLFASLEFSLAASDYGVQPIIGCILKMEEPAEHGAALKTSDLVVLARDQEGYQHLLKLVSLAFRKKTGTPTVAWGELKPLSGGLIALTGGPAGVLGRLLREGQQEAARKRLEELKVLFPGALYVELMRHRLPEEQETEQAFIDLAYAADVPLVATNDVYFSAPEMFEAHDALICVADGRYVAEANRRRFTREHYFKSAAEMEALFADIPEAIQNTVVIARRCAVMSRKSEPVLPHFPTSEGRSEAEELKAVAHEGLDLRLAGLDQAQRKPYVERLDFELSVINRMEYPGYFLIVSDFMRWGKSQGIPLGPGRGSGAGSVVAWALQITNLDPLRFGLLFERFLNPERVSMPDFDIDFCQERRDEVIAYVQGKYGEDRVAQIITFGKLQARAVLRDVGRVLQMPYGQVDKICKMIPFNPLEPVTLSKAIGMDPLLQKERDSDPQIAKLLDIGLKLEGLHRHASTHAAGIVIGDRPLEETVPLYYDPRSPMPVTQYAMKQAEQAGLVKFDFLGLKTLTLIARAVKLIERRGIQLDIENLTFDDPKTFKLLSDGNATGVFQMESAGMRDSLRKLRPDTIEDIIALISLYRPGPMEHIPTYVARKHGREKPDYPHPKLEGILKETFGVIIYQEQVMQIAQVLAGYSLGAADLLRRAMGKKIKAEMDAQRDQFVNGAIAGGVDGKQASSIFDLVAKFAGYGFNKSHAAAYAVIGYQTAYLKANYPVEFYTASMDMDSGDTEKLGIFRQEAASAGIKILPPDINHSRAEFDPENGAIRYALGALRNVGKVAMEALAQEREAKGVFKDIYDFAGRADAKIMSKRQLENLAKAGAFDEIHPNRRQIFDSAGLLTRYNAAIQEEKNSNQVSLFGGPGEITILKPVLPASEDWKPEERMNNEFEALGFYLTAHPLDKYKEALKEANIATSVTLEERVRGQMDIRLAGVVTSITHRASATRRFTYIQFSDPTGMVEISIFDEKLISEARDLLESKSPLLILAEARKDEGGIRLSAKQILPLDAYLEGRQKDIKITLAHTRELPALKRVLGQANKGKSRIHCILHTPERLAVEIQLPDSYGLSPGIIESIQSVNGVLDVAEIA